MYCTSHSFNPFRNDFHHQVNDFDAKAYANFKSGKGRMICLQQLLLSPISIPCKIAKKVFKLVEAIFAFLAEVVHIKEGYFNRLGKSAAHLFDRSTTLIFSPLNITFARLRYLAGLAHPGAVFHRPQR